MIYRYRTRRDTYAWWDCIKCSDSGWNLYWYDSLLRVRFGLNEILDYKGCWWCSKALYIWRNRTKPRIQTDWEYLIPEYVSTANDWSYFGVEVTKFDHKQVDTTKQNFVVPTWSINLFNARHLLQLPQWMAWWVVSLLYVSRTVD